MGTSTALDALLLVVLLSVVMTGWLASWLARELAPARPRLPAEDCPPPSASRLVPVGRQLDLDARRGIRALELWLAHRGHR
jgi:hypothetical protein